MEVDIKLNQILFVWPEFANHIFFKGLNILYRCNSVYPFTRQHLNLEWPTNGRASVAAPTNKP